MFPRMQVFPEKAGLPKKPDSCGQFSKSGCLQAGKIQKTVCRNSFLCFTFCALGHSGHLASWCQLFLWSLNSCRRNRSCCVIRGQNATLWSLTSSLLQALVSSGKNWGESPLRWGPSACDSKEVLPNVQMELEGPPPYIPHWVAIVASPKKEDTKDPKN